MYVCMYVCMYVYIVIPYCKSGQIYIFTCSSYVINVSSYKSSILIMINRSLLLYV